MERGLEDKEVALQRNARVKVTGSAHEELAFISYHGKAMGDDGVGTT
jgi:hypothetical protein